MLDSMTPDSNNNQVKPTSLFNNCTACGYDLAGLPHGSDCPECGVKSTPPEGPGGTLGAFVVCPSCGYSLGGLTLDANCPECNAPCSDAVIEQSLYRSGSAYVNRIASGASMILLSAYLIVFAYVAMVVVMLGAGTLGAAAGGVGPMAGMVLSMILFLVFILGAAIVWLIGWIRATTQDPTMRYAAVSDKSRGIVRAMAITVFCLQVSSIVPFVGALGYIGNLVCIPIFFFTSCRYIKRIGERIPDRKMTNTASRIATLAACLIPIMIISGIIMVISAASAMSTLGTFLSPDITLIASLAMFISGLGLLWAYLRLVGRFAKSMKAARQHAESLAGFIASSNTSHQTDSGN